MFDKYQDGTRVTNDSKRVKLTFFRNTIPELFTSLVTEYNYVILEKRT